MADTDWSVADKIKPQTPQDVIAPLTAYTNMQLGQARAREVGIQARQQDAVFGARQRYQGLLDSGTPGEQAVVQSGLSAIDPAGTVQNLEGQQKAREIGAIRNYDPTNPYSLKAGGPALVGAGVGVQKSQAEIPKIQSETAQTQTKTTADKMQLVGQIGQSYLASDKSSDSWNASIKMALDHGLITPMQAQQNWGKPNEGLARQWAAAGGESVKTSGISQENEGAAKAKYLTPTLSPGQTVAATPAAAAAMSGGAPAGTPPAYNATIPGGQKVQVDAQGRAIQNPPPNVPLAPGATGRGTINAPYKAPLDQPVAQGHVAPMDHYAFLKSRGATDNEALMLTGAAASESSLKPTSSHDDGVGYGMYGHNMSRIDMRGMNWQQQATAALNELRSRPEAAMVNRAKTPQELAIAQMHFEQPRGYTPGNPTGGENYTGRFNTLNYFAGMTHGAIAPGNGLPASGIGGPGGGQMRVMPGSLSGPNPTAPGAAQAPTAPIPAPMMLGQPQQAQQPALQTPQAQQPPQQPMAPQASPQIAPQPSAPIAPQTGATAPHTGLAADSAAAPLRPVFGGMSVQQQAYQHGAGENLARQDQEAREAFQGATSGQQNLQQLQIALSKVPEGGGKGADSLLAPGPGAAERLGLAKTVNTALSAIGAAPMFDPAKISAQEESQKITGRLGFDLSRTMGSREAAQVVQQAIQLNPGIENTPQGARTIIASLNAGLQRQRDFYAFRQEYTQQHGTPEGADIAFDKARPVSAYVHDVHSLAAVPEPAIELLQKHAGNPRAAAAFDQQYGPGLSRYYVGQ